MKLNDVKHNHSLTDLLKVLLFAIVMLLPFIDVAVRCLYVIANKNAYQSYSGSVSEEIAIPKYNTNELQTYTDFVVGNFYVIEWNSEKTTNNITETLIEDTGYNNFKFVSYWSDNMKSYRITNEDDFMDFIIIYIETTSNQIFSFDSTNDIGSSIENYTNSQITNQVLLECTNTNGLENIHQDFTNWFNDDLSNFQTYDAETVESSSLDNVFQYSVTKLEESQLYNWTTQTAIYNGVSQMTGQLGITTNIIPIIICYWFFITIIYIILDIVIRLFTILTHFIGSKIAN